MRFTKSVLGGTSIGQSIRPVVKSMIRESLEKVATTDLRRGMAEIINRAAYGSEPVVLTKRGHPVAAIISYNDLVFLMSMKKRRDEARRRPMPSGSEEVGLELARRLREELFFG